MFFSQTPFQNAHGWAWFHAAASFCSRKNSPSTVYTDVHCWENPLKQVKILEMSFDEWCTFNIETVLIP